MDMLKQKHCKTRAPWAVGECVHDSVSRMKYDMSFSVWSSWRIIVLLLATKGTSIDSMVQTVTIGDD